VPSRTTENLFISRYKFLCAFRTALLARIYFIYLRLELLFPPHIRRIVAELCLFGASLVIISRGKAAWKAPFIVSAVICLPRGEAEAIIINNLQMNKKAKCCAALTVQSVMHCTGKVNWSKPERAFILTTGSQRARTLDMDFIYFENVMGWN
jgi:hypothetical protein